MFRSTLMLALVALIPSAAIAGAPGTVAAPCVGLYGGLVDVDGDGYCVAVAPATFPVGTALTVDCDDAHAFINPGAAEIRNDGHNNDCNAATLDTLPVSEQVWKRYVAAEYAGRAPSWETFVYEKAQCAANCTVDDVAGRFVPESGYRLADIFVNGGTVMRTHGEPADGRDLVTDEQYSHFQGQARSGSGYGKKGITTIASELDTALEEALREEIARVDTDVAELTVVVDANTAEITEARGGFSDMDARFDRLEGDLTTVETEVIAARGSYDSVHERIVAVEGSASAANRTAGNALSTAQGADEKATKALSAGFYADLLGTGGLLVGARLPEYDLTTGELTGNTLRAPVGVYGGGSIALGAQLPGARIGPFASLMVIGDGGPVAGSAWNAGFEALFQVKNSAHYLGPFAAYTAHNTMLNSMEGRVVERGPMVGLAYLAELPTSDRFDYDELVLGARLGCGPTTLGAAGDIDGNVEVLDMTLFQCGLQLSVGGGVNTAVGR